MSKRKLDEVELDPNDPQVEQTQNKLPKTELTSSSFNPATSSDPQQQPPAYSSYSPAPAPVPGQYTPEPDIEDCPELLALPRGEWVSYVHETVDAKGETTYKPMLLTFDPANLVIHDRLESVPNITPCEAKVEYHVVLPELGVDRNVPLVLQTPSLTAPFGLSTAFNKDKNDTKSAVNLDLALGGTKPGTDVVSFKLTLFDIDEAVSAKVEKMTKAWWPQNPKLQPMVAKAFYSRLTRNRLSKPPKEEKGKPRPANSGPFVPTIYPPRLTSKVFKKGPNAGLLFDANNKPVPVNDKNITKGARLTSRVSLSSLWVDATKVNWSVRWNQGKVDQLGQQANQNLMVSKNS